MTIREQHEIALPVNFLGDYEERCGINADNGPLTDEVRERAFRETIKKIEKWMAEKTKTNE